MAKKRPLRLPPATSVAWQGAIGSIPVLILAQWEHPVWAGVTHGGVLMAFADTLGAIATVLNLAHGQSTTTLESKTNFIAAAPIGAKLTAEATPLHRGRRTQVWETRITRGDGKLVAKVTQTQMVL